MRSIPTTPVAQSFWVVGVVACVIMMLGATTAGLVLMAVAVVAAIALRIAGVR
ncbi:MAG TPA: hypothetical protein VFA24_02910 [Gaiellaceae bacterium]|nr:hypothetical protein [Gaiellaceae bacterium]